MPDPVTEAFAALQAALAQLPPVVIVIVLLGGPTLAWLAFRTSIRSKGVGASSSGRDVFWVCRDCRSANEVRDHFCYRCGLDRTTESGVLRVIDEDAIVELRPDEPAVPLVPVGPGRADTATTAAPVMSAAVAPVAALAGTLRRNAPAAAPATGSAADPDRSWTCARCLLPNAIEDDQCTLCRSERPAPSGGRQVHLAVVPEPPPPPVPTMTKPRRVVVASEPPTTSSRRDAAS